MEDYKNILIKDLDVYKASANHKLATIFKRYNVLTVGNLLDEDFINPIYLKLYTDSRVLLQGFIALVRSKYQNTPIAMDYLLNEKCIDKDKKKSAFSTYLTKLGFCTPEINYIMHRKLGMLNSFENETGTIVERFKKVLESTPKNLKSNSVTEKMKFYVEYYDKRMQPLQEDNQTNENLSSCIMNLRQTLKDLIEQRNSLDKQIISLEHQIETLSQEKGSIVK